jgi:hypothetical protein
MFQRIEDDYMNGFRLHFLNERRFDHGFDLSTLSAATDVTIGLGDPVQEIADVNF